MSRTLTACGRTPNDKLQVYLAAALFLFAAPFCRSQVQYNVTTYAGNGTGGFTGDGGQASSAEINGPYSVAVNSQGNLYIADQLNHRIRVVSSGGIITTSAGNGTGGYAGDGSSATGAQLNSPVGVVADSSGTVYIADTANNVIRKVASGTISTIAGIQSLSAGYAGDGGSATVSLLNHPSALALDKSGNLYFADTLNHAIRKIDTSGNISTVAGTGHASYSGDGGPATSATLNGPSGIAVDSKGNLYIGDTGNHRVRRVAAGGTISTVAGIGTGGFSGDGGAASNAKLYGPKGIAVDGSDLVYIADSFNGRIRRILADGTIETIAGNGSVGYAGDGGAALDATFYFPSGVAVDSSGKVYVADNQNHRIRLLTAAAAIPIISGMSAVGAALPATAAAPGSWIEIYGRNIASSTKGWTQGDFDGVHAPTSLAGTSVSVGGQAAFVSYVSAGQVNAQIPSNVSSGSQQITVTNAVGTSAAYAVTIDALRPLLYAPDSFKIGSNQYVLAQLDASTYAAPAGAISGVASRPAKVGETIVLYGFGFGPVTPDTPAGQMVDQPNMLASQFLFLIGGSVPEVQYAGLAPGAVGLYQFNLVVPNIAPTDLAQILFSVGGAEETQTLYIAVQ